MRFLRRALTGFLMTAATLALLVLAVERIVSARQETADDGGRPAEERVFAAAVLRAEARAATPVITVYGEVRAARALELRAASAGRVIDLSAGFRDGGRVTAGEVLMRLDPAEAQASRDLAAAGVSEAQALAAETAAALSLAHDDLAAAQAQAALRAQALDRQRDLDARGVGSAAAVEAAALAASAADQAVLSRRSALAGAEAAVGRAASGLERARITLAEADRALSETVLTAPFDGALAGVTVIPGRLLSPNERLGDLIDPAVLDVAFRLSAQDFARLADAAGRLPPLGIKVALESGGTAFAAAGRVTRVSAAVGEGQTGREVFATLDTAAALRPGDFVTVTLTEPPIAAAVDLPATALGSDGAVLVLGAEDRLSLLPVTLLRRQGDRVLLAPEGLAGREVVTDRAPVLGAGIRIRPVRPGQAGEAEMIDLSPERRAALIAQVEGNTRMPADAKARLLAQLNADGPVPARIVARLEGRDG